MLGPGGAGLLLRGRRIVTTGCDPASLPLSTCSSHPCAPLVGFAVEKGCRLGEGVYTLRDRAAGHAEWQRGLSGEPGAGWVAESFPLPGARLSTGSA